MWNAAQNRSGTLRPKGSWNANTNSPALASGVGSPGDLYEVSADGATALDGTSTWKQGDFALFFVSGWKRIAKPQVSSVNGETGAVTGLEATASKGQASGYASLDGDGKVPSAQLPASGGGGDTRIQLTENSTSPMSATTAGYSAGGHCVGGMPVLETGTYKIRAHLRVGSQTNNPSTFELRAISSQALLAVDKAAGTTRTLYAANAVIFTHNKGSAYAAGDFIDVASANISLNAGEFIRADGNAAMFQVKVNGSSATLGLNGSAFYLEKQ